MMTYAVVDVLMIRLLHKAWLWASTKLSQGGQCDAGSCKHLRSMKLSNQNMQLQARKSLTSTPCMLTTTKGLACSHLVKRKAALLDAGSATNDTSSCTK